MLGKFHEALEAKRIPFYWDANCNLIDWIKPHYLRSCAGRLKNFIKKIDQLVLLDSTDKITIYLSELNCYTVQSCAEVAIMVTIH